MCKHIMNAVRLFFGVEPLAATATLTGAATANILTGVLHCQLFDKILAVRLSETPPLSSLTRDHQAPPQRHPPWLRALVGKYQ